MNLRNDLTTKINNYLYKLIGFVIIQPSPRHSIRFAKKHFKNKKIQAIEIGTHTGTNAESILKNLNIKKFFLVDPYQDYVDSANSPTRHEVKKEFLEGVYLIARKKLKKYSQIIWIKKTSDEAAKLIPKGVDLVYIDGNHTYDYVLRDLENYYTKISPGGILAGHDISMEEVLNAVQDFTRKKKIHFQVKGQDWWILK